MQQKKHLPNLVQDPVPRSSGNDIHRIFKNVTSRITNTEDDRKTHSSGIDHRAQNNSRTAAKVVREPPNAKSSNDLTDARKS